MKHLLIILISFLLLSSPVIGDNHKGETLYRWGENPDYKWMGFGDKDTHPVYQGQVKDGKPNGLGVIIYPDGIWKGGNKYVGEWKNGKHWNGTSEKDGKIEKKVVNGKYIKP